MADNQPDPNAAASGAPSQGTPQQPAQPPADNNQPATLTFDSFDADQKTYLQGQGITKQEDLTPENIAKVINHARSSQQTAAQRQAELDKFRTNPGTQNPGASGTPGATGPTDGASGATGANGTTPTGDAPQGLDKLTAYQLTNTLVGQYPKLADKLKDGSFYSDMATSGFAIGDGKGGVNLDNLLKFAEFANKEAVLAEKEAELNKADNIPDANGNAPQTLDSNTPMTLAIARNIVLQDKSNPRFKEAEKFIQDNAK